MITNSFLRRAVIRSTTAALGLWLAGCANLSTSLHGRVPGQLSDAVPPATQSKAKPPASQATSGRDYRRDAAQRIYALNRARIYAGKLPPALYAVGTLQVYLDANGRVNSIRWLRIPEHAPEVIAEIERTVLAASPYPAAPRIGKPVWTDTWLWDQSGRFQLDSLSEGQLQPGEN